jgi:hypothetical protein
MKNRNNIRNIIRYLSGELSRTEQVDFERNLKEEPALYEEFKRVSEIWDRLSRKLKLSGDKGTAGREEIIATIMAAYDVERLGGAATSKQEKKFERALKEAMDANSDPLDQAYEADTHRQHNRRRSIRLLTFATLASAAVVSLLLVLFYPEKDLDYLVTSYYHPAEDLIPEHFDPHVRSGTGNAVIHFASGDYTGALDWFKKDTASLSGDPFLQTLYAISLVETGFSDRGLELLEQVSEGYGSSQSLDAAWYRALLLIRSGNGIIALPVLDSIIENRGYHAPAARKLKSTWNSEQEMTERTNER